MVGQMDSPSCDLGPDVEVALNPHSALGFNPMPCRKLLLFFGSLALLIGACWLSMAQLLRSEQSINKANYDRIEKGMTYEQVQAILGPPGRYTQRAVAFPIEGVWSRRSWIGDEGSITIWFGPKKWRPRPPPFGQWEVQGKEFAPLPCDTWLDQLIRASGGSGKS
jgi:hypothetical protein